MENSADRPYGKDAVCHALVSAATTLIARMGVAGVTTRAIAERARVNQGLITRYFGSKQGLVRQVANEVATRLFDEVVDRSLSLEDLLAHENPGHGETLRALIHIILDAEAPAGGLMDKEHLGRFFRWLREQVGGGETSEPGLDAKVHLVVALVLGSELVAPSVRADLGLSTAQDHAMRRQAARLFMRALRLP